MLGSEGHFGQAKITSSTSTVDANSLDYPLVISEVEVALLVELVANSLHERGKDGCGGYSAATFGIKYVLFAMRCLLTHTFNQTLVAELAGRKVCTLFLKILALHSLEHESGIDAEDAEHVCFSLYLLSNYGFKVSTKFSKQLRLRSIFSAYLTLLSPATISSFIIYQ